MKRLRVFLIGIVVLLGCDETETFIVENNAKPVIEFIDENNISFLQDSIKTSGLVGQFPRDFEVRISDVNGNISGVGVQPDSDAPYLLVQYDSILVDL
ncbi:MAG: hypothetical protein AAF391_14160, partial [Bacteroidota bacterium]